MVLNLSDEVRILRNYDESLYIKLNKAFWQKVTTVQHTSRRCPAVKIQHQLLLVVNETKSYLDTNCWPYFLHLASSEIR